MSKTSTIQQVGIAISRFIHFWDTYTYNQFCLNPAGNIYENVL